MTALRALAAIGLLALAAAASADMPDLMDGELNGRRQLDRVQLGVALLEGQPKDARAELKKLYDRYDAIVEDKMENGWTYGLLSEDLVEGEDESQVVPARQAADALVLRQKELAALEKQDAAAPSQDLEWALKKKRREVRAAEKLAGRTKGTCIDWSDLLWYELGKLDPQEWTIEDQTRDAPPYHTAAVLCTPADAPTLCVAFDPSWTGEPAVYEYNSWNLGKQDGRLPAEFFLHHLSP